MSNTTTNQVTLQQDGSLLNIFSYADAFARPRREKLPSPCSFLRDNKLKRYRYRKSKDGNVILSVVSEQGRNFYAKERNFVMAYIKLVRNFNCSNIKP